jgi:cyclopropane fatty-acyl-phospholipid synthase-like methyltransferase
MKFDYLYYHSGNYKDYTNRGAKYKKIAIDICNTLHLNEKSAILDYGCGIGLLLEALSNWGYKYIYGYDISEWAKSILRSKKIQTLENYSQESFDVTICLDVLEHMDDNSIKQLLRSLHSHTLVVKIPVSVDGNNFYLPISRVDATHINCKTKQQWLELLNPYYDHFFAIHTPNLYDSKGVFCGVFRRSTC